MKTSPYILLALHFLVGCAAPEVSYVPAEQKLYRSVKEDLRNASVLDIEATNRIFGFTPESVETVVQPKSGLPLLEGQRVRMAKIPEDIEPGTVDFYVVTVWRDNMKRAILSFRIRKDICLTLETANAIFPDLKRASVQPTDFGLVEYVVFAKDSRAMLAFDRHRDCLETIQISGDVPAPKR